MSDSVEPSLDISAEELASKRPANTNSSLLVETWPAGDPRLFARVVARILVRRALIDARMIPDEQTSENPRRTG